MKIEEKYKLEKYTKEDGSEVNVYFDIDRQTIWMSQKEMSLLVNKSKSTINEHIKKLYDNEEKYVSEFGFSESWNKEKYFNLNVVFKITDKYDFKECLVGYIYGSTFEYTNGSYTGTYIKKDEFRIIYHIFSILQIFF